MTTDSEELLAGRYRRLGTIGTGGMARVVLAHDERLGRQVAIKRLHADSPAETARRFDREARLGASLNHPNVVAIYDVDCEAEDVLIVMEYVEGETLKEALARGPLDPPAVVSMVKDIAAALDHAHAGGVVHRDVKPGNILLRGDGVAKLADLGIATAAETTRITRSGFVVGTAAYMAPEQLSGGEAGPAADIYALGAVAYEALSGQRARSGTNAMEVATEAVKGPPPDIRSAWPAAPPVAAGVIERCLAPLPDDRPATAGELASELERALDPAGAPQDPTATLALPVTRDESPPPRRPSPPPPRSPSPADRPVSRHRRGAPAWLPFAALAALVLVAVVVVVLLSGGDSPNTDRAASSGNEQEQTTQQREPAQTEAEPAPAPAPAPEETAPAEPEPEPADDTTAGTDPAEGARLDQQAFALIQEGRYSEAVPIAREAVASFPEDSTEQNYAYALYNLGTALNRSGNPDEAIPYLEKRLSISSFKRGVVEKELKAAQEAAG